MRRDVKACENDNSFSYMTLEYDHPIRFLPICPGIWRVWQEVVYLNLQRLWTHLDSINSLGFASKDHDIRFIFIDT